MLRLILAVLFRAGSIEVTQGGEKFTNYSDPRCRPPFINNNTFKSSLFTPVKPIDLKTLTRAVESYEDLTGETVDVDKNAIAEALKKFAAEEMKTVLPIEAQAKAHQLPVLGTLQDYREVAVGDRGGFARRLREHPGRRRHVAQAGPRPDSQDRRMPGRQGPRRSASGPPSGGPDVAAA